MNLNIHKKNFCKIVNTEKLKYERLLNDISVREKKIESDLVKIGKLKEELRKWKGDRTKGFNKMIKYYKKFLPTFSTFLGGEDDGNPQWGMFVSISGKRRYVYIGTVNEVVTTTPIRRMN